MPCQEMTTIPITTASRKVIPRASGIFAKTMVVAVAMARVVIRDGSGEIQLARSIDQTAMAMVRKP